MARVIDCTLETLAIDRRALSPMLPPSGVLMCAPEHFDIVDVKNPFMEGQRIDRERANAEWEALRRTFADLGAVVETVPPAPGCEDMVFTANQTLTGLLPDGTRACMLSNMRHESRRREVPAFQAWFAERGWRILPSPDARLVFEGAGDALWHPGRRLLWGGVAQRTEAAAYPHVSELFDVDVVLLPVDDTRFYHLDTCFVPLDEGTALVVAEAFTDEVRTRIDHIFDHVLEVPADEALSHLAGNATAVADPRTPGRTHVVLSAGARLTRQLLEESGYEVHEAETAEFQKSGGSVFCMKQYLW